MNEKDKYRYIFVDTSFENRTRFNWITECLLGDIRTFLDGIEYYIIREKVKPAGKLPRGGGNLSVPILVNTALEFVAALYAGKTEYIDKNTYSGSKNKIIKGFIERYFPEGYKEFPLLLWDGVRNGLIHTFSPKPFEYKGSYIRFQFYVDDQNFPSHIEKVNSTIMISINVFELYRVLEKAIEVYRADLENNTVLQDKFFDAWSSIEDHKRDITKDREKSKEADVLLDCLDSKSSTFLLKDLNDHLSVDVLKIYSLNPLKIRRS
jgi:hypothetical protein